MGSDATVSSGTTAAAGWEEQARNWVAWVRKPDFDSYWYYRDGFFDLVGEPGAATLDLGCGEGRVSRDLRARGHRVTGVDVSQTMIDFAAEADPDGDYRVCDARELPFADGAFDIVIAYNTLMDVDDLAGSMAEAARVLAPGGRMCVATTHPLNDAGRFETGPDGRRRFVIEESYFARKRVEDTIERDGMLMTFHGWTNPLSAYTRALETAGLVIEAMREPVFEMKGRRDDLIPYHLWTRAVRPA
ncbi:class I SAM-dependent methyltransferase [Allokutzneria sp. A3M-2-11 16]|uniref:class I SAM-dependent methyltransferase n=1 Tax=Allokutzneria sp. A3M-2-11 16 TaxID=2962043 RepID=UPI0020B72415|nr:class I SAM-dependent methyltransferase [Allokutzneria sp. A3M-2-11 16]MCP3803549.1 class I SAM-dependent methyltransferase [Allokutzneria sp. A3M-2-11 16]